MEKIYKFEYNAILEKKINIKSFNIPEFYQTTNKAKLDIQMVIDHYGLAKKLPFGSSRLKVLIVYNKGKDGRYYPEIGKPKIEPIIIEGQFKSDIPDRELTFWGAIKLAFRILFKRTLDGKSNR